MKPRKKQPAITRQAILAAAAGAFSRGGYAATGIGAIVEASGLTRGALFHHFPDKRALALAWVGESLAEGMRQEWELPMEGVASLVDLISVLKERCSGLSAEDATSALVAIAAEVSSVEPVLAEALDGLFARWREGVAAVLARGQGAGWVHRSIRPSVEAGIVVAMFCGFSVMLKCPGAAAMRRDFGVSLEAYLETLRSQ